MKKLLLILLTLCTVFTTGLAAKKITSRTYDGEYVKAFNTFTYKKDNLIFPDKTLSYTLQDDSNLLDQIYSFMSSDYGVTEDQTIGLKVVGRVINGVLVVDKIENYRIPEENLRARENAALSEQ